MLARETLAKSVERLKIFPLPTAVLLPGAVLPLHIFEPRYRQMVADALAGDRLIAMSMLEPGWEQDYHGRPRVRRICGVGQITEEEKLPDGRYNIQLVGLARAEIVEELPPDEPYRIVRARLAQEIPPADPGLAETLRHAMVTFSARLPEEVAQSLGLEAALVREPGSLADVICAALAADAPTRQKVLEELSVQARLKLALDMVGEAMLKSRSELDDGGTLN